METRQQYLDREAIMAILQDTGGELWFRPSPRVTLFELQRLIRQKALRRTPRLGIRDTTHPTKGYAAGWRIMLRVFDPKGEQQCTMKAVVTEVTVRRLNEIATADLAGCEPTLRTWQDVKTVLSFFEGREVPPDAPVTLVSFNYLEQP